MMIWFNGTVSSAVERVKSSSSLLFVFIQGEDELSKKYEKFINQEVKFNPEHNYIAIKISNNSVAFEQFQKIYVTVPIPSIFLIGINGIPSAIVCSQEPSRLLHSLDEAVAKENFKVKNQNVPNENVSISKNVEDKVKSDPKPVKEKSNTARIQFRLPSNEIRSWEFPNMCTLHDVKLYLVDTMKLSSGFQLLRVYPRTAFTPQDEDKTLSELELTPNATLIVAPLQDEAIQAKIKKIIMKKNLVLTFVTALFQPVFSLVSYLKNLFFGAPVQTNRTSKVQRGRKNSVQKR
ncbi:UNVERIFIED_CONTAM: hypothetical protein PYX00_010529 [Menopon gallinae]|uniref:UBX domain-containing protein 4 n=2 Tax=Menopon gallinae TaxID=328185 RepID=A0AAW2HFZ2_9NEOP